MYNLYVKFRVDLEQSHLLPTRRLRTVNLLDALAITLHGNGKHRSLDKTKIEKKEGKLTPKNEGISR